jgi:hypothetical protein
VENIFGPLGFHFEQVLLYHIRGLVTDARKAVSNNVIIKTTQNYDSEEEEILFHSFI